MTAGQMLAGLPVEAPGEVWMAFASLPIAPCALSAFLRKYADVLDEEA